MRKSILAGAVVAALGMAGVASAGPLAPPFLFAPNGDFTGPNAFTCAGGFSCIAGEGAAVNDKIKKGGPVTDTAIQHLDWIVIHQPTVANGTLDDYLYLYQVENSSIAALTSSNTFSSAGKYFLKSAFGAGASAGDLDVANTKTGTGHDQGFFLNLAVAHTTPCDDPLTPCNEPLKGERELSPELGLIVPVLVGTNGFQLAATFDPEIGVLPGFESSIFGALGTAPTYGTFSTIGSSFTWNSDIVNSCNANATCEQGLQVAVPGALVVVPEPASLLLFASGLLGLGAWTRRRRQS